MVRFCKSILYSCLCVLPLVVYCHYCPCIAFVSPAKVNIDFINFRDLTSNSNAFYKFVINYFELINFYALCNDICQMWKIYLNCSLILGFVNQITFRIITVGVVFTSNTCAVCMMHTASMVHFVPSCKLNDST